MLSTISCVCTTKTNGLIQIIENTVSIEAEEILQCDDVHVLVHTKHEGSTTICKNFFPQNVEGKMDSIVQHISSPIVIG